MKVVSSLFGSLFLLIAFCFAVTNRQSAVVNVWPLDLEVEAPLYLLTLAPLFLGLVIGAMVTWVGLLPHRLATRRIHQELKNLHEKISDLHHIVLPNSQSPLPALPRTFSWRFWKNRS